MLALSRKERRNPGEGPEETGVEEPVLELPCDLRLPRGKRRARPAGHISFTLRRGQLAVGRSPPARARPPWLAVRPAL